MEIPKNINQKSLLRGAVGALLAASQITTALAGGIEGNGFSVRVSCSDKLAYSQLDLGSHAMIYVNADSLNQSRTDRTGGSWLYISKLHKSIEDSVEEGVFFPVGYSSDPN